MTDKPGEELSQHLKDKAQWVWNETLKIHQRSRETRVASSLSSVEIFVVLYYGGFLRFDAANPRWSGRDRCIASKGHGSLGMYPILADLGFFPAEALEKVCQPGGFLGGIPDPVIPGYETVNGSLGHGLGVGSGMALALKRQGRDQHVYVVVGDGELHEGSNWEALMFAAQHRLGNLTVIVDDNSTCMLGRTDDILSHRSLRQKFEAFGWGVAEVDGHSTDALYAVLSEARHQETPQAVIAHTIKGHGVPELEAAPLSHVMAIKPEVIETLLGENA